MIYQLPLALASGLNLQPKGFSRIINFKNFRFALAKAILNLFFD